MTAIPAHLADPDALARLNVPLYSSLEAETGISAGFRQVDLVDAGL